MLKASFFNKVFNTDKKDISDSKSTKRSEARFDKVKDNDVMATFLAMDIKDSQKRLRIIEKSVALIKRNETILLIRFLTIFI